MPNWSGEMVYPLTSPFLSSATMVGLESGDPRRAHRSQADNENVLGPSRCNTCVRMPTQIRAEDPATGSERAPDW